MRAASAGPVARDCLIGWYGENRPVRGDWLVAGRAVRPQDWKKPTLVVLPERDKLVPKAGAAALLAQLPQGIRMDAPSGHIGMVAGPRAETGLWPPLAAWLRQAADLPAEEKERKSRRAKTKVQA